MKTNLKIWSVLKWFSYKELSDNIKNEPNKIVNNIQKINRCIIFKPNLLLILLGWVTPSPVYS